MKKTLVVAELSANHGHELETALKSISAVKNTGADAIKIQTYTADTLTLNCRKPDFKIASDTLWDEKYYYNLYEEARNNCYKHIGHLDEGLQKTINSFEELQENYLLTDYQITVKEMVISTGIATIEDIELAIKACKEVGNDDITLLRCVSAYPAPLENVNLLTMLDMKKRFGVKVGLSDHTMGSDVAVAAVALGAEMIEKHFIIDRNIGGPDAAFSMNAEEFSTMVSSIRNVEKALGQIYYPTDISKIKGRDFSRSLYIAEDIKAGEVLTEKNLRSVRPGYGLHPKFLNECLGKKVNRDLEKGTRMSLEFII